MDFHCEKIQRAKKSYRCHSTGALIKPGDQYYYLCGVYEGDFYTCRMHKDVRYVLEKLNRSLWDKKEDGLCFNEVIDALVESSRNNSRRNKDFLRNLAYARRIAKLEGVPGWFSDKFSKKN